MIYLRHILAGILQGATELLPVASGGILSFFRSVWPAEGGLLAESALLHAGTALALILLLRKELAGVIREWFFLLEEIMENTLIFLRNSRKAGEYEYFPLMQTNMRKFSALLLLTMIPAGLAGYFLYPVAAGFAESPLVSAMGCFISAILLLVAALSPARSTRPREIPLLLALPVGLLAGMCVLPGFSCLSVTVASAELCGLKRKSAVRFAMLLLIPLSLGAAVQSLRSAAPASAEILPSIAGVLAAFAVLWTVFRFERKLLRRASLGAFAGLNALAGILAVIGHIA